MRVGMAGAAISNVDLHILWAGRAMAMGWLQRPVGGVGAVGFGGRGIFLKFNKRGY